MRFSIYIAAWGEKYLCHLTEIGLAALLAPNNLPAMGSFGHLRMILFVPRTEMPRLRETPIVQEIGQFCQLEIREFEPKTFANPHAALSEAHRLALSDAIEDGSQVIILNADTVISDGTLLAAARSAAAGKKVLLVTGLRLNERTAAPILRNNLLEEAGRADTLQPRKFLKFAMNHFHPEVARYDVQSKYFSPHPTICLWSLGDRGILQRAFHLHPLLIDATSFPKDALNALSTDTIDGALIINSFPNLEDIAICQDSDDILVFSLSDPMEHNDDFVANSMSLELLQRTAYRENVNALHRYIFTKPIRLHTTDLNDDWKKLEDATSGLAIKAADIKPNKLPDDPANGANLDDMDQLKEAITKIHARMKSERRFLSAKSIGAVYRIIFARQNKRDSHVLSSEIIKHLEAAEAAARTASHPSAPLIKEVLKRVR
jgi:hypothetical protein